MTSSIIFLALLCTANDDLKSRQFIADIQPAFHELTIARSATAAAGLNALRRRAAEIDIKQRREKSLVAFREAVGQHWPYDDASRIDEIREYQKTLSDIPAIASQAKSGRVPLLSSPQAIERLKNISTTYPHTLADHRAKSFLLSIYRDIDPIDIDGALRIENALFEDPELLSVDQLAARNRRAQIQDRRAGNREASVAFLAQLKQWQDTDQRANALLSPAYPESHEDYIQRVLTTLDAMIRLQNAVQWRIARSSYGKAFAAPAD